MIHFSFVRASVLSAALLLTTALAAPSFAETSGGFLPELSPRQIAADVQITHNPQTGVPEFTAPSFDPFEDSHDIAGTAQLRSVSHETAIDGQALRGGAVLDLSFYYNSNSSDPYENRGFEEAVFLSGEYAPIRFRDHQILDCSQQVQDVVYYHEDYYAPSFLSAHRGLYRPYRHYTGFSNFSSLGFGLSPFAFSSFGTARRSFGGINPGFNRGVNRARIRNNERRSRLQERLRDRRNNRREDAREDRRDNDSRERETRRDARGDSRRDDARRDGARRAEINRVNRGGSGARTERRDRGNTDAAVGARSLNQSQTPKRNRNAGQIRTIKAGAQQRTAQPKTSARQSSNVKSSQTRSSQARSKSKASTARNSRASSKSTSRAERSTRNFRARRMIALSPMASLFGRRSGRVESHCAREEKLSLHISQDRLDAARFDGLTVLVLSRTGEELPVYIPPNYIEGYRQAAFASSTGTVQANPVYTQPQHSTPHISRPDIVSCPSGTIAQPNGTCLAGSDFQSYGYPTR